MKVNDPTPRIHPSDVNRHNTPHDTMVLKCMLTRGVYCTALDWLLSSKVVSRWSSNCKPSSKIAGKAELAQHVRSAVMTETWLDWWWILPIQLRITWPFKYHKVKVIVYREGQGKISPWPDIDLNLKVLNYWSSWQFSRLIYVTFKKIYTQYYTFKNNPVVLKTFEQTVGHFWVDCKKCRARWEEHFIRCMYAANSYCFLNMQAWNCSVNFFCARWPLTLGANWRSHELKITGVGSKSLRRPVLKIQFFKICI